MRCAVQLVGCPRIVRHLANTHRMWVQILVESFQDFSGTSNPSACCVQRQQYGAWGFHSLAFERAVVVESDATMEIAVSEARMVDNVVCVRYDFPVKILRKGRCCVAVDANGEHTFDSSSEIIQVLKKSWAAAADNTAFAG